MMKILKNNFAINMRKDICLWQPRKKVIKNLSQKITVEKHGTSILLMYPKEFETILRLSYPEILFWLVESDVNLGANIIRLALYKLSVTSAPEYMYNQDFIKYWIENDQHHRLTGANNWGLTQSEDGDIILLYRSNASVLHAKLLTHQCMLDFSV